MKFEDEPMFLESTLKENLDDHLQCSIKDENGWIPFKEDSSSIDDNDVIAANLPQCDQPKNVFESDENEDVLAMADELELSEEISSENDSNPKPILEHEPSDDNNEIENFSNPPTISVGEESKNMSEKLSLANQGPEDDDVTNGSSSDAKTEKIGLESGKLSEVEDGWSSQTQIVNGESSFSSAAPLASLVNDTGPVTYSGNLSIRSDSSTTSARSFAFPILQPEWHHNSPVRMAEADRRFFRRHKGWRQGLFCCKF